jgi:hypothetical protein
MKGTLDTDLHGIYTVKNNINKSVLIGVNPCQIFLFTDDDGGKVEG